MAHQTQGDAALPATPAELTWDEHGLPIASRFGDFYFSRADGLAESRYVFLQHNQLPQRWQEFGTARPYVIAETGFGTGLNFLATWQAWRQHAPKGARLHFISVEKYPLRRDDLHRALALWPELHALSKALCAQYPLPIQGFHRLCFDGGAVSLTLIFDDAETGLSQLDTLVDSWYLDGFSPALNPGMWTPALFATLARLSHSHTRYATFTAASAVQKGLRSTGFQIEKAPGFGLKREMLCGGFDPAQLDRPTQPSWYQRPIAPPQSSLAAVVVIGAGIAGASTARALADQGCPVTVIDRGPLPASEGSGNPQGVLYIKLPTQPTPQGRIHLQGYQHSLNRLQQLQPSPHGSQLWAGCGVLQLASDNKEQQRQTRLRDAQSQGHYPADFFQPLDRTAASALAGVPLTQGGLWFPSGGWIAPARLCHALLDHPLIKCRFNTPVADIVRQQGLWQLLDNQGHTLASATQLVVACAASSRQFTPLKNLPLKSIRGQITQVEAPGGDQLQTVLCGNGYVSPPHQGRYCFGATFTLHNHSTEVLEADHQQNFDHLRELSPALAQRLNNPATPRHGRTGFRCATPDYLPLAGPVADTDRFIAAYAELRHDARHIYSAPPPLLEGLYVNLGHGSKGLVTAPLCGELVAAQISAAPLPLPSDLLPYLHPARFLIKDLKRRAI
ncbi:MAG TPA: bifunctional tRNA (5-methylaminomethyl-2-thiouridine)(34)-methyltransferase MnmD/FAD-dependent 5-carboxymethylaminomethyl-2-thiouridine(34) oxidoreductase MnmC [Motiliproteus sp.]